MASISKEVFSQIIDLSARDVPPKDIAERTGLDRQTVYLIRSKYPNAIGKRRTELAARDVELRQELTADQATDTIMNIISGPVKPGPSAALQQVLESPEPEPLPEAPAMAAHMLPRAPDPTKILRTTQLRFSGARHRYTVTGTRIGIDGGALMLDIGEIDGFVAELREIQQTISGR